MPPIVATIFVLLFLAALLVNRHDEPLAPEARALLTPPQNSYQPADNIYVALLGLDAPPAESVIAAGEAQLQDYNRAIDAAARDPAAANLAGASLRGLSD